MINGTVLTIAGSDSSGGAGIQADLKTITALNAYGMSAITALTAQNTQGVFEVVACDHAFISLQIDVVLSDIGADVIKTGMLFDRSIIDAVSDMLSLYPKIPRIIDPVMVATSGSVLLKDDAIESFIEKMIPNATLITPNIPEAELLSNMKIHSKDDMVKAGEKILELGTKAVLVKGGHAGGETVTDVYLPANNQPHFFTRKRIKSENTHGTGCTLASAIAAYLSQGQSLENAIEKATLFVAKGIEFAPNLGKGNGPLNHSWAL